MLLQFYSMLASPFSLTLEVRVMFFELCVHDGQAQVRQSNLHILFCPITLEGRQTPQMNLQESHSNFPVLSCPSFFFSLFILLLLFLSGKIHNRQYVNRDIMETGRPTLECAFTQHDHILSLWHIWSVNLLGSQMEK